MIFVGDDRAEDHHDVHMMDEAMSRLTAKPEAVVIGIETGTRYRAPSLTPATRRCWLIWARNRHTTQLRNALREHYPAALEAFDDLAGRDALAVLGV